jgi:putative ABC transport system substrate-binding protein
MQHRRLTALLGSAIALPCVAAAQQKAVSVIGYLASATPEADMRLLPAFLGGLNETSYVEGQNLAIEYRWAEGRHDWLVPLASDLVKHNVGRILKGASPPICRSRNQPSPSWS